MVVKKKKKIGRMTAMTGRWVIERGKKRVKIQ